MEDLMAEITLSTTVDLVLIASKATIGTDKIATGIFKEPVQESLMLTDLGLQGDFQVDRRVHGGLEKALHHYNADNYALLAEAFAHLSDKFIPGSIGENISTSALSEKQVHIGDVFELGGSLIQVSQPRRPCWKVNHKYHNAHIAALLVSLGITGWYYRVLKPGLIQQGDQLIQIERLQNSRSVRDVWRMYNSDRQANKSASILTEIPALSMQWLIKGA